jgi:hypothetical protein
MAKGKDLGVKYGAKGDPGARREGAERGASGVESTSADFREKHQISRPDRLFGRDNLSSQA